MSVAQDEGQTPFQMLRNYVARRWLGVNPEPAPAPKIVNPLPSTFYNPLRFIPGGYVKVDADGIDTMLFKLKIMYELTRIIDGKPFKMTDYSLHCATAGGSDGTWRTVRAIDNGKGGFDVVLYQPDQEFDYDKGFEKMLEDAQLTVTQQLADKKVDVVYTRQGSYKATVREYSFEGAQPPSKTKYWDLVNTEKDQPRLYLVEEDLDAGRFQTYRGEIIHPSEVVGTSGHTAAEA